MNTLDPQQQEPDLQASAGRTTQAGEGACPSCHGCRRGQAFVLAGRFIVDCGIEGDESLAAMQAFRIHGKTEQPFQVVASKAPGRLAAWPFHFEPEAIASCAGFDPKPEFLRPH